MSGALQKEKTGADELLYESEIHAQSENNILTGECWAEMIDRRLGFVYLANIQNIKSVRTYCRRVLYYTLYNVRM